MGGINLCGTGHLQPRVGRSRKRNPASRTKTPLEYLISCKIFFHRLFSVGLKVTYMPPFFFLSLSIVGCSFVKWAAFVGDGPSFPLFACIA
eukprot:c13476_g1_i2 orf=12-284(-)